MDACEPRVRRRGFFLHSSDGNEPDTGEHENPEGFAVRVRFATRDPPQDRQFPRAAHTGRSNRSERDLSDDAGDQIRERDWQPSTGTLAPLIQLARADARNATTAPTSSGRPNRPNGSSVRTNVRHPRRVVLNAGDPTIPPENESTPAPRC